MSLQKEIERPKICGNTLKLCLSCGRLLEKHRKRYCTQHCKEEFVFKLRWFNNLLRVLRTKYATFSFTEAVLILNVVTANSFDVHTYFYDRSPGCKPSQDMNGMIFELGEIWWGQKERTKSERYASQHILNKGRKCIYPNNAVKPVKIKHIAGISQQLTHLMVNKRDLLQTDNVQNVIKSAYKRAALKHHPDMGGDAEMFRKIHKAYEDIKHWLRNPSYHTRRGVPGQWCFVAVRNKWMTPL